MTVAHERPTMVGRCTVTIDVPTAADVWDTARWDTARWDAGGSEPVDVTCDVAGLSISRGRDGPTGHVRPGEIVLEVSNEDGRYTPWLDTPQRRRRWWMGAPIRVDTVGGRPLFTGYVAAVQELDAAVPDWAHSVLIRGSGPLGHLALADDVEQPAQGAHELAGARLARILDHALLPSWIPRQLDDGIVPLQATTLAKSALEEAWLVADSDGGALLELADGTIRYVDPTTFDNDPRYTEPTWTFGDGYPGTEVCIEAITTELNSDNVYNAVGIACVGGTVQTATAPANEWAGKRSFQRTDLIHEGDAHSAYLAQLTLERLGHRELMVTPLVFDPLLDIDDDPRPWDAAIQLAPYDRVRLLRWRHDHLLDLAATVDQIVHQITPDSWTTTVALSPGDQDFDYTRWDVARWDRDTWE
jgi:hypothetical protein